MSCTDKLGSLSYYSNIMPTILQPTYIYVSDTRCYDQSLPFPRLSASLIQSSIAICTVYSAVQSVQYSTVPLVDWRIGGWHSQRERWSQMDRHSNIYTTLGILTRIPTFLNWGNIGGHLCCIEEYII